MLGRCATGGSLAASPDLYGRHGTLPRKSATATKKPVEQVIKDIRRASRRHFSAEDNIRIVLDGIRGDDSFARLCRKVAHSLCYT